jgi:cytochrome c oxidase subunit 2
MRKYYILAVAFCFIALMYSNGLAAAATPATKQNPELSGKFENGVRVIEVKASRYKYEPDPIVVKLGERVAILATSTDVAHGFAISEFKVNSVVNPGKQETIAFIPDKEGEFSIYCTVYCGPGHMNMQGKLIVIK